MACVFNNEKYSYGIFHKKRFYLADDVEVKFFLLKILAGYGVFNTSKSSYCVFNCNIAYLTQTRWLWCIPHMILRI